MFLPPPMDYSRRSLGVTSGKEPASQCRRLKRCRFSPWVGKIPWRRAWNPLQYSCLENLYGQRSLVGYDPSVAKSQTRLKWLSMPTRTLKNDHILGYYRSLRHLRIWVSMIRYTQNCCAYFNKVCNENIFELPGKSHRSSFSMCSLSRIECTHCLYRVVYIRGWKISCKWTQAE